MLLKTNENKKGEWGNILSLITVIISDYDTPTKNVAQRSLKEVKYFILFYFIFVFTFFRIILERNLKPKPNMTVFLSKKYLEKAGSFTSSSLTNNPENNSIKLI